MTCVEFTEEVKSCQTVVKPNHLLFIYATCQVTSPRLVTSQHSQLKTFNVKNISVWSRFA